MKHLDDSDKQRAVRRGLRMAAKITIVAGVVAAASAVQASTPASQLAASEPAPAPQAATTADDLARMVRGQAKGNCGCAPCWGPPAPPAMDWIEQGRAA
jgi:hypothetical protein